MRPRVFSKGSYVQALSPEESWTAGLVSWLQLCICRSTQVSQWVGGSKESDANHCKLPSVFDSAPNHYATSNVYAHLEACHINFTRHLLVF